MTRISTVDALASLFLQAEDAYFTRTPTVFSGTISMEPLVSDHPGPPVYLTDCMTPAQRRGCALDLEKVADGFRRIAPDAPEKTRIARMLRCIQNVQADVVYNPLNQEVRKDIVLSLYYTGLSNAVLIREQDENLSAMFSTAHTAVEVGV